MTTDDERAERLAAFRADMAQFPEHEAPKRGNALPYVIGARFGAVLLARETLDFAFPGQVGAIEDRLSEEYTRRGEA